MSGSPSSTTRRVLRAVSLVLGLLLIAPSALAQRPPIAEVQAQIDALTHP